MNFGKVGIIFSGGGFTGAFSVGFIKAIMEKGIRPEIIQGVSIGALNAAVVLESGQEKLEKMWLEIEKKRARTIFDWSDIPGNIARKRISLYSNKGIVQLLNMIDMKKVLASPIEFQIVTCNEKEEEMRIFSTKEKDLQNNPELLKNVILASTALQGFLPPVIIDGEAYIDNLVFSIQPLIDAKCETIFVLLNDQGKENNRWDRRLSRFYQRLCDKEIFEEFNRISKENKDYYIDCIYEKKDEKDSLPILVKKLQKITKKFSKKLRGAINAIAQGEDIIPRQIRVFNTRTPIQTFDAMSLEIGDVKAAIEQGYDQASVLLKKLGVD